MTDLIDQSTFEQIPHLGQTQGSTADQLAALQRVANRLGLYDAADAIERMQPSSHRAPIAKYLRDAAARHAGGGPSVSNFDPDLLVDLNALADRIEETENAQS